jgi:hypothetical protein
MTGLSTTSTPYADAKSSHEPAPLPYTWETQDRAFQGDWERVAGIESQLSEELCVGLSPASYPCHGCQPSLASELACPPRPALQIHSLRKA